jgi:hypothetical protein
MQEIIPTCSPREPSEGTDDPLARPEGTGAMRRRAVAEVIVGGTQVLAATLTAPVGRRRYNRWGATAAEVALAMPGDELVAHPVLGYTRAITISAPMDRVWRWLVQMGQGRGGLYSFDGLENLVGCDIHSADRMRPTAQQLAVGDLTASAPAGIPASGSTGSIRRWHWCSWGQTPARHTPPRTLTPRPGSRRGSGSCGPPRTGEARGWSPDSACPTRRRPGRASCGTSWNPSASSWSTRCCGGSSDAPCARNTRSRRTR